VWDLLWQSAVPTASCFLFVFLLFLFLLLLAMAPASDTDLSGDDGSSRADGQLWADLPRQVRKELGGVGGALPASDVIAFSVDSERDAHAFAQTFAPGDERAIASFVELWRRAQAKAMQVCRRRARVDPADQFVRVSCKLPRLGEIGLHDNLLILFEKDCNLICNKRDRSCLLIFKHRDVSVIVLCLM